jgi:hypothetical protein
MATMPRCSPESKSCCPSLIANVESLHLLMNPLNGWLSSKVLHGERYANGHIYTFTNDYSMHSSCLHPLLRLSTTSANEKSVAAQSQSIPCIIEFVLSFEGRRRSGNFKRTFFGFLSVDGLQLLVITRKRRGYNRPCPYFGTMTR